MVIILRRPSSFSPSFCRPPLLIAVVNVGLAKASRRRPLRVLAERRHQDDDFFDVFLNDDDDSDDDDDAMEKFALKLRSMWCRLILSLSRARMYIFKKRKKEKEKRALVSLSFSLSLSPSLSKGRGFCSRPLVAPVVFEM